MSRSKSSKKASKKVPPQPKGELFSLSALAEMIDSYPGAVRKALKGVPPLVNLPKLKQYKLTQINAQGKSVKELLAEIEDPKLNEAKTRSAIADAELRELKVQERKRNLVPYAEVVEELQRVFHDLHQRLVTQQPRDLGPKLKQCKTVSELTLLLKRETARVFFELRTNYKSLFGNK